LSKQLIEHIVSKIPNKEIITSQRGQWGYPGRITKIYSNKITMGPDPITGEPQKYNLLIVGDQSGQIKFGRPGNQILHFPYDISVTEYPLY
tara:strand:+ start:1053 stop:1325 length:273 start_codon:yes stop_codon:yes gene_type:complete